MKKNNKELIDKILVKTGCVKRIQKNYSLSFKLKFM